MDNKIKQKVEELIKLINEKYEIVEDDKCSIAISCIRPIYLPIDSDIKELDIRLLIKEKNV